jgi:two-component system nitrate/nitrite response regulator NarL
VTRAANRLGKLEAAPSICERLVAKRFGNKDIASSLNIAEVTLKLHVGHVLENLDVEDRTQSATVALRRGIIFLE